MTQVLPSLVLSDAAFAPRPSACPGLLRIVAARDGGICRIRLPGGVLSAEQADAIARASAEHAAGVIELTNRANLQVRGVRREREAALIEALMAVGLGPEAVGLPAQAGVDRATRAKQATQATQATQAADDIRNVMLSPAAGRDPGALIDTRPLCAGLLALLQREARFAALSPKFALLVDGGEWLAQVDHPHDVWFAAAKYGDEVRFVFGLAGCPGSTGSTGSTYGSGALAAVLPSQVVPLARALLLTFIELAKADATRMRHLLAAHDIDTVLSHAQRHLDFPLPRDTSLLNWQRATPADATRRFGAHAQRVPHTWQIGGQPPLGRLDAASLHGLATLARQHGNGTLHMTPWQSVLLPDIAGPAVSNVLNALEVLGLVCDPTQPLARLIACTGSSGCAKGRADTKADALQLATRLPAGVVVHLSGCERSCAAAHPAPFTLLAVEPGYYDLYRSNSVGRDTPDDATHDTRPDAALPLFGRRVASRLTIEQAAGLLERLARSPLDA